MYAKAGNFTQSTGGTGNQSITGVGFEPRVVLVWTAGGDTDDTAEDTLRLTYGGIARDGSDVITQRVIGISADDGGAVNTVRRRWQNDDSCITIYNGSATLLCAATGDTTADGFDLNWTTNDNVARIFHYICLGNFPAAKWVNVTEPGSTGNQTVTGAGFTPTAALTLHSRQAADGVAQDEHFGIGFADGTRNSSLHTLARTSNNAHVYRGHRDDSAMHWWNAAFVTTDQKFALTSFNSDGGVINWSNRVATDRIFILFMEADDAYAGTWTKASSATPTDDITSPGFEPAAVLTFGRGFNTINTLVFDNSSMVGASTAAENESSLWWEDNGTSPINCAVRENSGRCGVPNGSSNRDNAFTVVPDSSGFDAVWQGSDTTGYIMSYFALGTSEVVPSVSGRNRSPMLVG